MPHCARFFTFSAVWQWLLASWTIKCYYNICECERRKERQALLKGRWVTDWIFKTYSPFLLLHRRSQRWGIALFCLRTGAREAPADLYHVDRNRSSRPRYVKVHTFTQHSTEHSNEGYRIVNQQTDSPSPGLRSHQYPETVCLLYVSVAWKKERRTCLVFAYKKISKTTILPCVKGQFVSFSFPH